MIKEALKSWPNESTQLALEEAVDFARRCSNLQRGDLWTPQDS